MGMFLFITGVILLIAAGLCFIIRFNDPTAERKRKQWAADKRDFQRYPTSYTDPGDEPEFGKKGVPWWISTTIAALGVLCIVLSCLTQVGARNQGVVTSFGQIQGSLDSGLHFKAPWEKVTDMDATVQTDNFTGTDTDKSSDRDSLDCLNVRIADGSTACVSIVLRSQIAAGSADDLYPDFRHSSKYGDNVNDNIFYSLTRTNLTTAVGNVFADVNPVLTAAKDPNVADTEDDADEIVANVYTPGEFNDPVKDELTKLLDAASPTGESQVVVTSLNVTYIGWSEATEQRIAQYQQALGETRIARQDVATARAQADAADELAQALSDNPAFLSNKCLDQVQVMIDEGYQLPIGYTCFPGGDKTPVIVAPK